MPLQLPLLLLLLPLPLRCYAAGCCNAALMRHHRCRQPCSPPEPQGAAPALLPLHYLPTVPLQLMLLLLLLPLPLRHYAAGRCANVPPQMPPPLLAP